VLRKGYVITAFAAVIQSFRTSSSARREA